MLTGLVFTGGYMLYTLHVFGLPADEHILGIPPEGIGAIGAVVHFTVTIVISTLTRPPSQEVQEMEESIRYLSPAVEKQSDSVR